MRAHHRHGAALLFPALLTLAGCGGPEQPAGGPPRNAAAATVDAAPPGDVSPRAPAGDHASVIAPAALPGDAGKRLSCAAQLGAVAAQRLVAACRNASPATHPPCNAANSCAMIEDEIARSCALFDAKGDPIPGCAPAPKSAAAAAAVVARYYSALNARDYDTAWAQWGEGGAPNQTRAQFEAGYARTGATTVTIGALPPGDGAAGSLYQPVPVTVTATLRDGTRQRFRGEYVVRRVNDVSGATPEQLRWHLASATLKAER